MRFNAIGRRESLVDSNVLSTALPQHTPFFVRLSPPQIATPWDASMNWFWGRRRRNDVTCGLHQRVPNLHR